MFTDTHCHIHEDSYIEKEAAYERALSGDVKKLICVGTNNGTSTEAVDFSKTHDGVWASIGVHPHDSTEGYDKVVQLAEARPAKLIAIGEIGLDYFYTHSPKETQRSVFEAQLQLAVDYKLPVIFHVREAFDDFWPIFNNFQGLKGVLHSYTDNITNFEKGLSEGLYIGLNGISTFTNDEAQKKMFDTVPLENMLLETDAPFLTPTPHRGKVNEPAFVRNVAEYHAERREVELEHLARVTSANASRLFGI
jgi:TatD DNase family protein